MPLLPSHLLLHASSATLLAISYTLIFSPTTLLQSTTLTLLGASMHIPPASFVPNLPSLLSDRETHTSSNPLVNLTKTYKTSLTTSERELLALMGLILALAAITQSMLAFSLRYNKSELTKDSSTGKRASTMALGETIRSLSDAQTSWMTVAAVRVVLTTLLVGWMYVFRSERRVGVLDEATRGEGLGVLANHMGFAVGLVDMLFWGYVYTVLKEERREVGEVVARRRVEEEEDELLQ